MRTLWLATGLLGNVGCDLVLGLQRRDDAADASIDTPPAFTCPTDYVAVANAPSKYRFSLMLANAVDHHRDCENDAPGATHLLAVSTMEELVAIHTELRFRTLLDERLWIGVVQNTTQGNDPGAGWIGVTDEPPVLAWSSATLEPNDAGDGESGDEQVAHIQRGPHQYLIDGRHRIMLGAICECDGRPVAQAASVAFTQLPLP